MFYAVKSGRQCGIYKTWDECKQQVNGFKGARFKKFKTRNEALDFMRGKSTGIIPKRKASGLVAKVNGLITTSTPHSSIPVVYTDGGCFNNGKGNASAGIGVYWGRDDKRNLSERLEGLQTNQRAELNAAIRALEQAVKNNMNELEIRTDSMYTINCVSKWIQAWKKNGWKSAAGSNVKNQEDIKRLDDLCQKVRVNWVHVRGHQGEPGNEEADRLSKEGASMAML
eukprot:gene7723-13553_t